MEKYQPSFMTPDEIRNRFPNASAAFIRANASSPSRTACVLPDNPGTATKLERVAGNGAVGSLQAQAGLGGRFYILVTSFRKRLLDQDNLAEKYHVDLLRYAGVIPSDAPGAAEIKVTQQKVGPKEAERVTIQVWKL